MYTYFDLSTLLNKLSFKLKQKSLYFELKYFMKNKQTHLKIISGYDRGIGKTYTLLQLAHKYNCPIAVPNYGTEKYLRENYRKMFNEDPKIIIANESSRGKRENMILCEEGINNEQMNKILKPMAEFIVGYQIPEYKYKREYKSIWF